MSTDQSYELKKEQKERFSGLLLLDLVARSPLPTFLAGDDRYLEPVIDWLTARDYILIENQNYAASEKGKTVLRKFRERYTEYLLLFDVFCAVDLSRGEFALAQTGTLDELSRKAFLEEERWEDLRIAVAEFKGADPLEIVFMSLLREGRFRDQEPGWQFDLVLGSLWDELSEICRTALKEADLSYEDEEGLVSGKDVLEDVIRRGTELAFSLMPEEKPPENDSEERAEDGSEKEEIRDPVYRPVQYYTPYYDPFYISPLWFWFW